ncbi:TlpA family protein disulfide reductase [Ulvibacter antarcticus]|uniref:Thiol-disulfide isomerase/thioredoxin n=1 Tax=Ulvibacter antarcticus TaxID=442714 RepID=A0A3L9YAM9_9FLAO|nr:thioredoxin family protein [Ulvibacter antarcticus]RMA57771.1 thiol-disulfide isomerase/thioredoxin [Ulvibacter antarcticus]
MKKLLLLITVLGITACNMGKENKNSDEITSEENNMEKSNETMNKLVDDPEEEGSKMLIGKINYAGLKSEPFDIWFNQSNKEHMLDTTAIDLIKPLLENVSIKVFMGTWCEDSQREVPGLYKVLNASNYNIDTVEMIAVSRDKDTPAGLEKGFDIQYVPTIIFEKDNKELGRIVEYTQDSLERDILAILNGSDYQHSYAE